MEWAPKPARVSLYNTSVLKTTLDDHLALYLSSHELPRGSYPLPKTQRFTRSHALTNIRLILGYSAVLIALYAFYLDWYLKVEFAEIKGFTLASVCAYFVLNSGLTAYIWFVERGCIFQGSRVEGGVWGRRTLTVRSHAPANKFNPMYKLEVTWGWRGGKRREEETVQLEAPFMKFFKDDSYLNPVVFDEWVRAQLPWLLGEGIKVNARPIKTARAKNSNIGWDGYAQGIKTSGGEDQEDKTVTQRKGGRPSPIPE